MNLTRYEARQFNDAWCPFDLAQDEFVLPGFLAADLDTVYRRVDEMNRIAERREQLTKGGTSIKRIGVIIREELLAKMRREMGLKSMTAKERSNLIHAGGI